MNPRPLMLMLTAVALQGCFLFDGDDDDDDDSASRRTVTEEPPPPPDEPPHVEAIVLPDWPPLGPDGVVAAMVVDDCCLDRVEFMFLQSDSRAASGRRTEVTITGAELGEGFGSLSVSVWDENGSWAMRSVRRLLVDLTPPTAEVRGSWLPAHDAEIEVWAGDAFLLGRVALEFQGVMREHVFPQGFPDSLGVAWDQSLVRFPTDAFPEGAGEATLTVVDAAGNTAEQTFPLTLDGTRPVARFTSPAEGAQVGGRFDVSMEVSDDLGEVEVALFADGAFVAQTVGLSPSQARVTLNAADFPTGPLELTAIALDAAGNESRPATLRVENGQVVDKGEPAR
jgi:hypothetical protein